MKGILYGVGVGPGDPELLTAKAIRLLRECDAVAAPKSADGRQTALDIASPYIGQDKTILLFDMPMTHDRQARNASHDAAADALCALLDEGKTVLFEGGQATMLDVDHGTYPFVTSSNPTAGGACTGTGVGPTKITRVIGVSKAYVTRVGEGPFPTELFGEDGEWLRAQGHEYGVTTGRPRRCGWFDAVVNRYAAQVNGLTDIVLTKLDVLTGLKEIPLCVAYDVNGERRDDMPTDQAEFAAAKPIYESMPGWDEDISQVHDFNDLPKTCQDYVKRLEELSGCRISVIGTGPQRDHIIQINSLID